jgi:hypothetical protein
MTQKKYTMIGQKETNAVAQCETKADEAEEYKRYTLKYSYSYSLNKN